MAHEQSTRKSHSQLYEQLIPHQRDHRFKKQNNESYLAPIDSPMSLGEDGVDHINIWEHANTALGQALAHGTKAPFTHSHFGAFSNMEALWHWVQSRERDDRIRNMSGYVLKSFSRALKPNRVTNFKAIIADSNWQKIQQQTVRGEQALVKAIRESELPFDCYYVDRETGRRTRFTFSVWLMFAFEEIRKAAKEARIPDFSFLMDKKGDIYADEQTNRPTKSSTQEIGQLIPQSNDDGGDDDSSAGNEAVDSEAVDSEVSELPASEIEEMSTLLHEIETEKAEDPVQQQ